jgi:hypothetical protein
MAAVPVELEPFIERRHAARAIQPSPCPTSASHRALALGQELSSRAASAGETARSRMVLVHLPCT